MKTKLKKVRNARIIDLLKMKKEIISDKKSTLYDDTYGDSYSDSAYSDSYYDTYRDTYRDTYSDETDLSDFTLKCSDKSKRLIYQYDAENQ